jgi:hypothetical protein
MSTGTGTLADPIIAMSADPAQIARDVRASLAAVGRVDDAYWVQKASSPAPFSNGLWHLGWNRYWEVRAEPSNTGSADPALGRQPATARAPVGPPSPVPGPLEPAPPSDLAALMLARLTQIEARLTAMEAELRKYFAAPLTGYEGTVKVPYLGDAPITLRPKS